MSNKSFLSLLNDQKFTGELITRLAQAYEYPLVDVAIALGTNAAARWIAGMYDAHVNIKHSAWERIWTAAAQGDVSVLRFLLTYASDASRNYLINATFSKTPPLTVAVQKNRLEAVRYLLTQKNIDFEKKDINSMTPLIHAAAFGHEEVFDELVTAGADINQEKDGRSVLQFAVADNKLSIVKRLIKLKADLNHQNAKGQTALIIAIINKNEAMAQALIEAGADVNLKDQDGNTALMWATFGNNEVIVKKLIEKKADLNIQNKHGDTALILAVNKNHEAIAQDLIAAGADLDKKSAVGFTALEMAIKNNNSNLVEKLVKVDSKIVGRKLSALEMAAFHGKNQIIEFLLDLNRFNNREFEINAAVFHALKQGQLDTVKLLLKNIDKVDNSMKWEGHSVLWYARTGNHPDKDEIIKLLIEKGAKE